MSCFLQSYIVALRCFNSVPLAPYFMRICTISKSSIFTISCKCIFGKTEIYVKLLVLISYKFIFWGKCHYECVCMCLTMSESPQNSMKCLNCQKCVKFNFNFDPSWTQLDPMGPHVTPLAPRGAQNRTPSHGAMWDGSHFN